MSRGAIREAARPTESRDEYDDHGGVRHNRPAPLTLDDARVRASVLGHGNGDEARLLLVPVPSIEPRGDTAEDRKLCTTIKKQTIAWLRAHPEVHTILLSAVASKRRISRWRKAGRHTAWRSLKATFQRPARSAVTFAASTSGIIVPKP